MQPQAFVNKWAGTALGEKQSAQAHFLDVCQLVGVEMPGGGRTAQGKRFEFELALTKPDGSAGYADVFYENHFAIEYKSPGKYKDLQAAFEQLREYKDALSNPPLLVVTDIERWEIHTNFINTQNRPYVFQNSDIAGKPEVREWLHDMFHAPERLHPRRHSEQVTQEAARAFQLIADNMRQWDAEPTYIAYFLTKLVFCMFAQSVRLLPTAADDNPDGIFTHILKQSLKKPSIFKKYLQNLFAEMNDGGEMMFREIRYFNGTLFIYTDVEELLPEALEPLASAAELNWKAIDPSIFGTLFERSLDKSKRSQLGAHYTSSDDILLVVEPVLMQPLRYEWDSVQLEAAPIREQYDKAKTGRERNAAVEKLLDLREGILGRIRQITVLDPACGSGNFLYVSLQLLMELEREVIEDDLWKGLQRASPEVHPRQMYGIEIEPIAHALASIVVWIGYIQWRTNNAYADTIREPILEELKGNIVCRDAILGADWPRVDVIVGNPPFLGGKKQRRELGDNYIERLRTAFPHIHGEADLSTYWFDVANNQIMEGKAHRAGLLSTNSIRGIRSRPVLDRIKESGGIFMAWSDREWVLDGAAVRVSMIGFDDGSEPENVLDGEVVDEIHPDLTGTDYISAAHRLKENRNLSFMGLSPTGKFALDHNVAQVMLTADKNNATVLNRFISGTDITIRDRSKWIIDFTGFDLRQAEHYVLPLQHLREHVKPFRDKHRNKKLQERWWQFEATRAGMTKALGNVTRQLMTSLTAKHRFFVWYPSEVRAANTVVSIARDDDYMFGVLHSKIHVEWALRKGATLEDRPRYNNSTCFETFPFPWSPGAEDAAHPAHAAISDAAAQLHVERDAWLGAGDDKDRTLTNLYNALQVFRGESDMRVKPGAGDFAPRLDALHQALDEAVCAAYGWHVAVLDDDEEILRRLLALNLARAEQT